MSGRWHLIKAGQQELYQYPVMCHGVAVYRGICESFSFSFSLSGKPKMQAGGPQGKRIPSLMDLCLASAVTGKISLQHPTKGEYTTQLFPQFPCA